MGVTLLASWTLYKKEVHRFLKVYHQTLLAPVISALTFFFIFALSLGNHVQHIQGVSFAAFMASGLIIMSITQNAFANSSSSLLLSKITGTIIDYIIPPIPVNGFILAYILAGMTRGIIVGIIVALALSIFVKIEIYSWYYLILFSLLATFFLAALGAMAGIFSNSFDQMAAITTYIITPLSFLSGTFYSVKELPPMLAKANMLNPFFYIIDGFRYSLTGYSDARIEQGASFIAISCVICYILLYKMVKSGYRLKD